ncbi:MAG: FAD-dependent oxidoreductase [Elusimicrobia bacterium]|nr:FAD-dependent oxidoreductase [Elusimicrobiota bacterium]
MSSNTTSRINEHPVLQIPERKKIIFSFEGKQMEAFEDEVISSALFANGVRVFSVHHKDSSPQGIFCANGQCSQCAVVSDGLVVKACVTKIRSGMKINALNGLGRLAADTGLPEQGGIARNRRRELCERPEIAGVREIETDVLIIGGGPSGLSAAIELGRMNVPVILADDKHRLGGKLVLQTHKFFGSVEDCWAGTRGIDIALKLEEQLKEFSSVKTWLNAVCVGIFSDKKAGIVVNGRYCLVKPRALVAACGAREKSLVFPGNTLPGVYGAGAFQTLVNRDLVRPSKKLFVVGAGNVGLIAAYHALQADIKVLGVAEALPEPGGYKVHADKIKRLGVPVYASHTVLRADGRNIVESVTIAQVDKNFKPIKNSEKTFKIDTLLIAVGLNPVSELYSMAKEFGMNAFVCGDAEEIAEASAAMFSGKITAYRVLKALGIMSPDVPDFWYKKLEVLKSKPGKTHPHSAKKQKSLTPCRYDVAVYPVLHCRQEIPCNPCVTVCPKKSIRLVSENIMSVPVFDGECIGCLKCLVICPALAVTLVDCRQDKDMPFISIPLEMKKQIIKNGDVVKTVDEKGNLLGTAQVVKIRDFAAENTQIITLKADKTIADKIASVKFFDFEPGKTGQTDITELRRNNGHVGRFSAATASLVAYITQVMRAPRSLPRIMCGVGSASVSIISAKLSKGMNDEAMVCRCERVALGEIRKAIKSGIRDINQLKAVTRAGMGSCGAKTCNSIILSAFKAEGVDLREITPMTQRPLFMEVPLGQFCNADFPQKKEPETDWSNF